MKTLSFIFIMSFCMISCSSLNSTRVERSWTSIDKNAEGYDNLFIVAVLDNQMKQRFIEDDMRGKFLLKNISSTSSHTAIRSNLWQTELMDKDAVLDVVKRNNKQGIITISIIDIRDEQRYIPGNVVMGGPMMMNPHMINPFWGPGHWGMGANFGNYWGWNQPMMMTPGRIEYDRKYFMEINLYDAETELLVWSAQSRTLNPATLEQFSFEFSTTVVNRMVKDGVLKKVK